MFFNKKSEDAEKLKKNTQLAIQHFLSVCYYEPGTHVN